MIPIISSTISNRGGINLGGTTPFFTTKDRGVGLGMALTHKIIEDHRGTIEVMSEKGMGTTFVLMLPVIKI
jgi:nitrogen-specific signal transduction histidine kinase